MIDRDIIIILCNADFTTVFNEETRLFFMESHYELGEVLDKMFASLKYDSIPLIYKISEEEYFDSFESQKLWERDDNNFFTQEELNILKETSNVEYFINKIKENLSREENM